MCADYYRHFSVGVRLRGKLAGPWVTELMASRRKTWHQLVDAGEDDAADAIGVDFAWAIEDGSLYLTDNGGPRVRRRVHTAPSSSRTTATRG